MDESSSFTPRHLQGSNDCLKVRAENGSNVAVSCLYFDGNAKIPSASNPERFGLGEQSNIVEPERQNLS